MYLNEEQLPVVDITPNDYQRALEERQQMISVSQGQNINNMPDTIPKQNMEISTDNPFSVDQYNNVKVPDMPISYGGSMADSLLNDNEVPEEIRKKYWYVFHKDNTLTFLDEDRKKSKLLNLDIAKIDELHTMPYYDYTFAKELDFTIMRNVFETKLDRALGINNSNIKNERTVLQSQFTEQKQISEQGGNNQIREGFFKRLLGRR